MATATEMVVVREPRRRSSYRQVATEKPKRKHRRRRGFELPVAVVAGMLPGAWRVWEQRSDLNHITNEAGRVYLGYDSWTGQFGFDAMKWGTVPLILGLLVHKFVGGTLGVNRMLARARLPVIRL